MVCNNCRYQTPDGLNFCPNCGLPFNPQFARPYQASQSFQQGFNTGHSEISPAEKSDKNIFILGIIAFSVKIFWTLIGFFGFGIFERFIWIYKFLAIASSVIVLLFAMIYVKKQTYKTLLLIFFLLLTIIELYLYFIRGTWSPMT
ncbi:MAG TPA: zinc ribbon domain-containing protein [Bacteroidia bacterium]|nr:zinc ribbon domain-containing protein [Bacteroidia bacterium]